MDSDGDSGTPLASFEAKWSAAHPEFGLALKFVAARERAAQGAFACLVFELEQAAFATPDAEPAAIKLQWWAEELTRAGRGEARHPLTRELAGRREFVAVPIAQWRDVVAGAFAQRDRGPAADGAAVLDRYADFHRPLGTIEAALFKADAAATIRALSGMRALRDLVALPQVLQGGNLPLPLGVLARHRLVRGDLSRPSRARSQAVGDWLRELACCLDGTSRRRTGPGALAGSPHAGGGAPHPAVFRSAMAAVLARRARRAARAEDPLATLAASAGSLTLSDAWAAWRAGRRSLR